LIALECEIDIIVIIIRLTIKTPLLGFIDTQLPETVSITITLLFFFLSAQGIKLI